MRLDGATKWIDRYRAVQKLKSASRFSESLQTFPGPVQEIEPSKGKTSDGQGGKHR